MWHFQGILRCDMCARDVSARSRVCPVLEIWFDVSARAAIVINRPHTTLVLGLRKCSWRLPLLCYLSASL